MENFRIMTNCSPVSHVPGYFRLRFGPVSVIFQLTNLTFKHYLSIIPYELNNKCTSQIPVTFRQAALCVAAEWNEIVQYLTVEQMLGISHVTQVICSVIYNRRIN